MYTRPGARDLRGWVRRRIHPQRIDSGERKNAVWSALPPMRRHTAAKNASVIASPWCFKSDGKSERIRWGFGKMVLRRLVVVRKLINRLLRRWPSWLSSVLTSPAGSLFFARSLEQLVSLRRVPRSRCGYHRLHRVSLAQNCRRRSGVARRSRSDSHRVPVDRAFTIFATNSPSPHSRKLLLDIPNHGTGDGKHQWHDQAFGQRQGIRLRPGG